MKRFCLFLIAACLAGSATAATYEGVTLPDTVTVGGQSLVLNGMGLRTYSWFKIKIYVGALYLPAKAATPEAVLAETGAYRVVMVMKHKVTHKQFADSWLSDLKANNPETYPTLQKQAVQFVALFNEAKAGDQIIMDYVPGQGVSVTHNGKLMGTVSGADFHTALLQVYVGPHPPTDALKEGMLGKSG